MKVVVPSLSRVRRLTTPGTAARQASLSSTTSRNFPNSCPLNWWCYLTISSSAAPFSLCLQSLPASGSFPVSQFFETGGQGFEVSASASVLPMNIQGWIPLGLTGLISLLSKGLSRVFSSTRIQKHQFFWYSAFFMVQLSHLCITTGKTIALTIWAFGDKVMSLHITINVVKAR